MANAPGLQWVLVFHDYGVASIVLLLDVLTVQGTRSHAFPPPPEQRLQDLISYACATWLLTGIGVRWLFAQSC